MSTLPPNSIQIPRPAPKAVSEVQVPPKAYLNFLFSLQGATSAKQGDDLVIELPDGSKVLCLGYYSNTAEGDRPQIAVNGEALPPSSMDLQLFTHQVEGLRPEGNPEGTAEGTEQGAQGAENGQEAGAKAPASSGATATGDAATAGDSGPAGQSPAAGTAATQSAQGSGSPASSGSPSGGVSGNEGGLKQDMNVDFLGGITRLPGLDLSSDRGFENTTIEGGRIWGNPTTPPPPASPDTPPVAPPPPTIFESVAGMVEGGFDANKNPVGTDAASHNLTLSVPDGMQAADVVLDFSLFPGAPAGELTPNTVYDTHYGKFSYSVTDTQIPVLDSNGNPVLDDGGNPVTRPGVEVTLHYSGLDNTHPDINSLPLGGKLNENMSFTVVGKDASGNNTSLGSANIGFVIEGSNDGPQLAKNATNLAAHFEVKETGVYNDNKLTSEGSWDDYSPTTPDTNPDYGTHKNTSHVQLGVSDVDQGDSHTFSLTNTTVSITNSVGVAWTNPTLVQNSDGSYTLKIDGVACGTLSLSPSGAMVFTLDNSSAVIQAMKAGDASTIKVNVTVTDKGGLSDSGDVTLTIHGTNDRPTITVQDDAVLDIVVDPTTGNASATLNESGSNNAAAHTSVSGKLLGDDVDSPGVGQADGLKFYIATSKDVLGKDKLDMGTDVDADGKLAGKYGTLVLNADGSFKYTENGSLGTGMSGTDRFYVLVRDDKGAFSYKELDFTVNGKDNPVEFAANTNYTLNMVEAGVVPGANANAAHVPNRPVTEVSGDVKQYITDNDGAGSRSFKLVAKSGAADSALVIERETFENGVQTIYTKYGVLTLDQNTGIYTYKLNDSDLVNALSKDDNLFERFTLQVIKSTQTWERDFSVNIQGSNDNPTLGVLQNLEVWEDNRLPGVNSSTAVGADVDTGDVLTYSLKNDKGEWRQVLADDYGFMRIDAQSGKYTYELDEAKVQSLGQYESYTKTFTVRVFDKNGAWAEQQVTVTIHGTLDAPDINYSTPTILEDNGLLNMPDGIPITTGKGSINVGAVDTVHKTGQQFSLVKANGEDPEITGSSGTELTIKGLYGTLVFNTSDGSYTYTLDPAVNTSEAMQKMNMGELFGQEKFIVRVTFTKDTDGKGNVYSKDAELVIDIKGTNDAPEFAGNPGDYVLDVTRTAPHAQAPSGSKTATATDVDNDSWQQAGSKTELTFCFKVEIKDAHGNPTGQYEYVQSIETQYGTVTIDAATGKYEYTLNNLHPDIMGLAKDLTLADKFTITVRDPHGEEAHKEVNVTINGADFGGDTAPSYQLPDLDLVVQEDSAKDKTEHDTDDPNDIDKADPGQWDEAPVGGEIAPSPSPAVRYCFVVNGVATMSMQGKYGTVYIDALTGQYRYVLDNMHSNVQGLGKDETATEHFDVYSYTYSGSTTTLGPKQGDITVTIKGVNDDPELVNHQQAQGLHAYVGTSGLTTSGKFDVSDVDKNDNHQFSLSLNGTASGGDTLTFEWGTVTINQNGEYTFNYAPEAGKILGGDTAIKFFVHVYDGTSWAKEEVTVNIIAKNVAPIVISCVYANLAGAEVDSYVYGKGKDLSINTDTGEVLLDGSTLPAAKGMLSAGILESTSGIKGSFGAWDHEVEQGVKPESSLKFFLVGADGKLISYVEDTYGTLEMQPDGTFIFTLNVNAKEVKALQHGENKDLSYKVVVRDANGTLSEEQDFTLTITGTNNQPEITFGGNFIFNESSGDILESGFTLTDPDIKPADPSFGFSVTGSCTGAGTSDFDISNAVVSDVGGLKHYTFTLTGMLNGSLVTFGELVIQMNPGNLTDSANMKYWFDLENGIIDLLNPGSNVNFQLGITFNDGAGVTATDKTGSTSNTANIGITIQGKPDAPAPIDGDDADDATASLSLTVYHEDGPHLVDSVDLPAPLAAEATHRLGLVSEQLASLTSPDALLPGNAPEALAPQQTDASTGPAQPLTLESPLPDMPTPQLTNAPGQEALQFQLQTTGV